jgi:hypothetical protein
MLLGSSTPRKHSYQTQPMKESNMLYYTINFENKTPQTVNINTNIKVALLRVVRGKTHVPLVEKNNVLGCVNLTLAPT